MDPAILDTFDDQCHELGDHFSCDRCSQQFNSPTALHRHRTPCREQYMNKKINALQRSVPKPVLSFYNDENVTPTENQRLSKFPPKAKSTGAQRLRLKKPPRRLLLEQQNKRPSSSSKATSKRRLSWLSKKSTDRRHSSSSSTSRSRTNTPRNSQPCTPTAKAELDILLADDEALSNWSPSQVLSASTPVAKISNSVCFYSQSSF